MPNRSRRRVPLSLAALITLAVLGAGASASAGCNGAVEEAAVPGPPAASEADASDLAVDAGGEGSDARRGPASVTSCFSDLMGAVPGPDYDKFRPIVASSCAGTHHQTISGVEKVVFLGDSITAGTPPTDPAEYYRARVTDGLKKRFGDIAVADCSAYGARADDLLEGKNEIASCFPGPSEPKRTLVVMTLGGNDIAAWAKAKLSTADALVEANIAAARVRAAIDWLQAPGRFPSGVFVVFANVYEYTDTSGDLSSCPAASLGGVSGTWPDGAPAVVDFQERLMEIATSTRTDLLFLFERFCGHGFKREDPTLQCYRGPNAELWFDFTCIHPTPKGHEEIARLFLDVVDEP